MDILLWGFLRAIVLAALLMFRKHGGSRVFFLLLFRGCPSLSNLLRNLVISVPLVFNLLGNLVFLKIPGLGILDESKGFCKLRKICRQFCASILKLYTEKLILILT